MREQLIGYLLDALDPAEHETVEVHLSRDPQLKRELELISRALAPLEAGKGHFDPPQGLAERTCEFVIRQTQITIAPPEPALARGHWRVADFVVAAGIFFAATMLFFPAMNQSRFAARLSGCQDNLRKIGTALTDYSVLHNGYFPDVAVEGANSAAGIYASKLFEQGFLDGSNVIVCPASSLAEQVIEFRVPTLAEIQAARGAQLARLHEQMGGSYGYNLGYVSDGEYRPTKNLRRPTFALMSDAPRSQAPYYSLNHQGYGQNVLFEDLHVQYLTTCKAHGCDDDIFVNDSGQVAPGLHLHDAVIGASHSKPGMRPTVIQPVPRLER